VAGDPPGHGDGARTGPEFAPRGGPGSWRAPLAGDAGGCRAGSPGGHRHRSPGGDGARRGRARPPPFQGVRQRHHPDEPAAADGRPVAHHLQECARPLPQPAAAGLGRRAASRRARRRHQHSGPDLCPANSALRPASGRMIAAATMQTEVAPPPVQDTDAEIKLDARHVNFWYGDFQALDDASLAVQARKITALIGPSGCGKTTFLRVFNRMHDLVPGTRASGEVLLDGNNVLSPDTDVINLRRQVGMLFQRANPFPKSIYDNVAYGPHILGWSKQQTNQIVEESLKDTGLWDEVKDRLRRSALNLSGGQQQRLCLARALAVRREVILMDEPASALDPIATLRIEELMQELKKRYTIVIVT